jgi:hypothetical protein
MSENNQPEILSLPLGVWFCKSLHAYKPRQFSSAYRVSCSLNEKLKAELKRDSAEYGMKPGEFLRTLYLSYREARDVLRGPLVQAPTSLSPEAIQAFKDAWNDTEHDGWSIPKSAILRWSTT